MNTLAAAALVLALALPQSAKFVVQSDTLDMKTGEQLRKGAWTLDPSGKLDVATVEVSPGETKRFCFLSGDASWCTDVRLGDAHDLTIEFQGRSYPTRVAGVLPDPLFSPEYVLRNKGTAQFLIPEAYELANVIVSLTPYGKQKNRIFQETAYYGEVQAHFGAYAGHPLIAALNLRTDEDFGRFIRFRENGAYFEFDGDALVRRGPYRNHWRQADNVFAANLELVEDFARVSGFRRFFAAHREYYASLVEGFRKVAPLQAMIDWLESRFGGGLRYDSYKVIFSPLVAFSHTAHRGETAEYKESLMFVGAPHVFGKGDLAAAEVARMIFTEIDHNFVNPVSDRHREEVDAAMANVAFWNDTAVSGGYTRPYDTFNEYMTWSVFSLWARDTYDRDTFRRLVKINRYDMLERGFPRFTAFDKALLAAVPQEKNANVAEAWPAMLKFARELQAK
ncbi:MAG TPA: DUF4932 domain-containing protein [Thermoanaerobaculia bacterium]|jgi:hypothetical protein